jgi:hypothetical protein
VNLANAGGLKALEAGGQSVVEVEGAERQAAREAPLAPALAGALATQADDRLAGALGDAAADGSSAPARAGVAHAAVVLLEVPEVLLDDALVSVREVMLEEARQRPRDRVLRRIEEVPPQLAQLAANPFDRRVAARPTTAASVAASARCA